MNRKDFSYSLEAVTFDDVCADITLCNAQFPIAHYLLPFSVFAFFYLPFRNTPVTFSDYSRFSPFL